MRKTSKIINSVLLTVLTVMFICLVWAAFTTTSSTRLALIVVAFALVSVISLILAFTAVWGANRAMQKAQIAYSTARSALNHGQKVERLYADMLLCRNSEGE